MAKKPAGKSKAKSPSASVAMPRMNERSVNIRKIGNGYILSESGMRGGQYTTRETFTRTQPKLVIAPTKE